LISLIALLSLAPSSEMSFLDSLGTVFI